jgi:hypothetical protein
VHSGCSAGTCSRASSPAPHVSAALPASELKYEIDKIQSSQRLDLNLERGRIRDELLTAGNKSIATEIRLDKEINAMKTTLEANKNDIIRFCVGAVASTTAVGLGILRLVL